MARTKETARRPNLDALPGKNSAVRNLTALPRRGEPAALPQRENVPIAQEDIAGTIDPTRYNQRHDGRHSLDFDVHARRRPWEAGNVHAPLIVGTDPANGTISFKKGLWRSNAYLDDKIVKPGPFNFVLKWPEEEDGVVHLYRHGDPAVFPLFYTEEGYVYLPKKVLDRNDRTVTVKYVEYWGWSWEPTRSPPRELIYKANVKAGLFAKTYGPEADVAVEAPKPVEATSAKARLMQAVAEQIGQAASVAGQAAPAPTKVEEPATPREDTGIDWAHEFREEVKTLELLNMTGSAHFVSMVGFPAHSDSGFFVEGEGYAAGGPDETFDKLIGQEWSTYSLWKVFQCLAKACAVMAWGSEYPDFPVVGWNQIIHLGLTKRSLRITTKSDPGHTCGGEVCVKIADVGDCIRWPAGDIPQDPYSIYQEAGTSNPRRLFEAERERALKETHYKGPRDYAPERVHALDLTDDNKDQAGPKSKEEHYINCAVKGNYGWWTNVWAIAKIMDEICRASIAKHNPDVDPASRFAGDLVVADPEFGLNAGDEDGLRNLTHLEQESYWRKHAATTAAGPGSSSLSRLQAVISCCTEWDPRNRMPIPDLLLECTRGLAESAVEEKRQPDGPQPLHWEADGQTMLVAHCRDRIRKLVTSNLYSRRDIGLRLQHAFVDECRGLIVGQDLPIPPQLGRDPIQKFQIRADDRQKWDEVVRRVFVDEHGEPAAEKVDLDYETRETSDDDGDAEVGDEEEGYCSEHEIDVTYGTQLVGKPLRRYEAKLGRWDVSRYWVAQFSD